MPVDLATVQSSESVRAWLTARTAYWGPGASNAGFVETLTRFCEFVGKTPDEIMGECLRPSKEGGALVLRVRARRQYIDAIERFEAETGSRKDGNVARSFLIHNGVAMNPSILA